MVRLQEDIINIYNSLTDFSNLTLSNQIPIRVYYEESLNSLCFEQKGKKLSLPTLNHYCLNLKGVDSYLLPSDYDDLMADLATLIGSGVMLHDRLLIKPINYGFEAYETNPLFMKEGPQMVSRVNFVVGNSWIFRKLVKYNYRKKL